MGEAKGTNDGKKGEVIRRTAYEKGWTAVEGGGSQAGAKCGLKAVEGGESGRRARVWGAVESVDQDRGQVRREWRVVEAKVTGC